MALSLQDLKAQQFHIRFRGFDIEEVDEFLEKVTAAFQELQEENEALKNTIHKLSAEIVAFEKKEKEFKEAILSAHKVSEQMKEKARTETDDILARAHEEAARIQANATGELDALALRIEDLRQIKSRTGEELRALLLGHLALLDKAMDDTAPIAATATQPDDEPADEPADDDFDLYERIVLPDSLSGTQTHQVSDDAPTMPFAKPFDKPSATGDETILDDRISPATDRTPAMDDPLDELEPSVAIVAPDERSGG